MNKQPAGEEADDIVLVGLGNPGPDYASTRHNLGAVCLDELGRRLGVDSSRRRWRSQVGSAQLEGPGGDRRVWLLWPQTYMNLSGRAVAAAAKDLRIPPAQVWVVHDELDLPLCRLRIRRGGSDAGNNGVASIISALGSSDFVRFRVGVGKPPSAKAGVRYVLGRFTRAEAAAVESVARGVAAALEEALRRGLERAMELYNRSGSLGCEELK
jgi:PTH1 family peptidyl-tRNA hydrolase